MKADEFGVCRALLESAPVAIYRTDMQGQITYANPEYRRVLGLRPEESLNNWATGVHPEDRPRMEAAWSDFCRNPRPITFRWRSAERDGACRVLTEQVVATVGVPGFVGTITDITETIAARENLRRGESKFRGTFDQAPIGIAYADREGRLLRCNQAFRDLLGYGQSELEAKVVRELTDVADVAAHLTEFEQLWRGDIQFYAADKRYVRKDQSVVWVRETALLVRDGNGAPTCSVSFFDDISARREMAAALQQSRDLLQAVIADVPVAIRACDVEGRIFLYNRAAEDLFATLNASAFVSKGSWSNGRVADVFLSDGITLVREEDRPLERALRGETVTNTELVIVPAAGATLRIVTSTRPIVGNDGARLGAVAVTQDITQRKTLELELAQAQKLESIGQLAAGIAHEINTPTQFIGDNVRFLDDSFRELLMLAARLSSLVAEAKDGTLPSAEIAAALNGSEVGYLRDEIPKAIAQSLEGIDRIVKIVSAMKEFSHPGLDKTPVDLNHAISTTITVASNEWKYVADVATDFDPLLPPVPVMPGPFNQVVLNIIVNAAHALGGIDAGGAASKGTISVSTRRVDGWAEIRIRDTGCGIPAAIRDRIFDPFFTTKPVGKGTGQGLAIAHDVVVKKHGGTITVDSEAGVGTTFTIRLPLETSRAAASEAA